MKKPKPFRILRKKNSFVFITKLESSDEYFTESNSSYVVVDIEDDLPLIAKTVETLRAAPAFEKISFLCHNAFVLPMDLVNAMSHQGQELLHDKLYGEGKKGYMAIGMPDTDGCYALTLAYATVYRIGESELFELYYEGFVETYGRTHVQSAYMRLPEILEDLKSANQAQAA